MIVWDNFWAIIMYETFLFSSRFLSDIFPLKMHAIIFTINHQWWQFSVHAPHVLSSRGCHKICIDQAVNTKTSHYAMYYIYIMYTLLTPLTDPIITTSFSYCTLAKFSVCQFRISYPYVMIGIYHDQNYSGDKYSFMYT